MVPRVELLNKLLTTEVLATWAGLSTVVYLVVWALKHIDSAVASLRDRDPYYRATVWGVLGIRLLPIVLGVLGALAARYRMNILPENCWPLVATLSGVMPILGWRVLKDRLGLKKLKARRRGRWA